MKQDLPVLAQRVISLVRAKNDEELARQLAKIQLAHDVATRVDVDVEQLCSDRVELLQKKVDELTKVLAKTSTYPSSAYSCRQETES